MNIHSSEEVIVNPDLYSEDYYYTDNEGCLEYKTGLESCMHEKFKRALELASPNKGDNILDIGCGRGELVYYCAKIGAKALGIDYSSAAIHISRKTIERIPEDRRHLGRAELGDVCTYNFDEIYDAIFMIEIIEHMHDWQLAEAFKKIYAILKNDGKLIITTQNYYYEKFLSPIKRVINIPLNIFKWPVRIIRGKYRPKNVNELLSKIFKVRINRGQANRMMHINVLTPNKIKMLLNNFDVKVECRDNSKNIVTLITRKWWGRDIIAIAKKKGPSHPHAD